MAAMDAANIPVPDMDDDLSEGEGHGELVGSLATGAAEATDSKGGYGPVRGKHPDEVRRDGIVFRPAQVEELAIEEAQGDAAAMSDGEEATTGPDGKPYAKPDFPALSPLEQGLKRQLRRVPVPPHRVSPLKACWMVLIQPLIEHMKLQVRMNTKRRTVEIRNSQATTDIGALQKAADYFKAFMLGFDQSDCVAMLRLDDLFIESFEVKDVKTLKGDHLSRCIGRIAGKDGKTKYAIENSTRTRISLCEDKIHILGSFANIKLARDAVCSLILGSAPGKVYTRLRTVSKRLQERI